MPKRRSHISTKQCIVCDKSLPLTNFYSYNSVGRPSWIDAKCKKCRSAYIKARRLKARNARLATLPVQKKVSKICTHCEKEKPLSEFPKHGRVCKACKKIYHATWRAKSFARVCSKCGKSKAPTEMQPCQGCVICKRCFQARTSKKCIKCGLEKPLTREFWQPAADAADGFRNDCLECRAKRDAARYEVQILDPEYRERKAKNANRWYHTNHEYALRRNRKRAAETEVKQRRQERDAERRANDPAFVEENKRRSSEWYRANRDRVLKESKAQREARILANGDGRKRPRDRSVLKYATEIWQPRKTP
jgi:hypothetical protein